MKKLCLSLFSLLGLCVFCAAQPALPLKNLTQAEMKLLAGGEALITRLASVKNARLTAGTSAERDVVRIFQNLDPNFLAEAVFLLPVEPGTEEKVLADAVLLLRSVMEFERIPYYSKRNGTVTKLFEGTRILESSAAGARSAEIQAVQRMRPFDPAGMVYRYTRFEEAGAFLFRSENTDELIFRHITAVKPGNMKTALLIEKRPGALFFYGLGGAQAFSFFGLFGDRLDVAFAGRIEAFFSWFHKEFAGSHLRP